MGVSEKHQYESGGLDTDNRKWVLSTVTATGISVRTSTGLRAITTKNTKPRQQQQLKKEMEINRRVNSISIPVTQQQGNCYEEEEEEEGCTTPKRRDERLSERLMVCPPAPRKQKSKPSMCHSFGAREFFHPPDLESVFIRRS